ncbi:toxin [Pseudomonas carnis]|uniref:Tc toxin subunit A-related protein n=1 Tax=Pseudomonas carnis TaxID=2487355 RepID=UPI001CA75DFA|nr:neuraminidase-like domain-containing protein [Pseudomonas carnis]MBY8955024.1 toxin [Pseudomonas carnis]
MSSSIDSQLNETLRDALVAYYLDEVVPNAAEFVDAQLSDKIKTANDLYQYKLLDVQVSQAVPTSPVASAIASIQQYINAALMGMEPGYETKVMEEHLIRQWREIDCQYPIWAANQQLSYYPELYIDPSLRLSKSTYFQQLENDLNQNKIEIDTTQEAVLSYLASFEEVANLTIINGYINTTDFKNGMYYFIGKSRAESVYYWRSVDMSQRTYVNLNGTDPNRPKFDYPQPGAWSDWHKADLPISASAIERTIRPVLFNNRLFVFWVECVDNNPAQMTVEEGYLPGGTPTPPDPGSPVIKIHSNPMLRLNMVYKKFDDSWSVPQTVIEAWSKSPLLRTENLSGLLDSIAVEDSGGSSDLMLVAMYAGYTPGAANDGINDAYAFLKVAHIDKNFNVMPLFPAQGYVPSIEVTPGGKKVHVLQVARMFALDNKERLQFVVPAFSVALKSVETFTPNQNLDAWNFQGGQVNIKAPRVDVEVRYDPGSKRVYFDSGLSGSFTSMGDTCIVDFRFNGGTCKFTFVLSADLPVLGRCRLIGGSRIDVLEDVPGMWAGGGTDIFNYGRYTGGSNVIYTDFLVDSFEDSGCTLPPIGAGGSASLEGKLVRLDVVRCLGENFSVEFFDIMRDVIIFDMPIVRSDSFTPLVFQHVILRPLNLNDPEAANPGAAWLNFSSGLSVRNPPDTFSASMLIDIETLLPSWPGTWPASSKKIPLIHGIKMFQGNKNVGHALRLTFVELQRVAAINTSLVAPRINTCANPTLGVAEFIDFTGSDIKQNDAGNSPRQPIRMNTLFARELINRANIALENLLSWGTQLLEEPPLNPPAAINQMDFHGANGLYFWELFLHLPFMVSHRLNQEQNFEGAEQWLGFIFDPSRKKDEKGRPAYWNVRPLMDDPVEMDYVSRKPADPDGIASSHPVRYRKAIYMFYIKNLLDRGDAAYRQLTPDSLVAAKLWYVRVLDLLGPRPDINVVDHWQPIPLKTLSDATNSKLREFEQRLIRQDQLREESAAANDGESLYHFAEPPLYLRTFAPDPTLLDLDNRYLRLPFNRELVQNWDTAEARLDNLRNNRTLDGKPLMLPLFAAPLNPRDLLAAFGQGAASGGAARLLAQEVPPYRYSVMHNRASSAVETLIQFGNTLLSLIERKEQAQLQELQYHQAWEFAQFAVDLQQQAQKIDLEQKKALEASKALAQGRLDFYRKLADEVVNAGEKAAAALHLEGRVLDNISQVANAVGSGLKAPPNSAGGGGGAHAGLTNGAVAVASSGGWRLEGVAEMVSAYSSARAAMLHTIAEATDRAENFRRRHQEWMQAGDQATLEIAQIEAQMQVLEAQARATTLQLNQARAAQDQALASYDFLRTRFSNAQLYQWLNGQFATFYYQAYDATLALCLAAEACWQFELADFSTRFIQAGVWKDSYRGLSAGEALKLSLLKMDSAYLSRNERRLEITKTVSLRQLKDKDPTSAINQDWDTIKLGLIDNCRVDFQLTQPMFDSNYPGHSVRRIKRISVSLPVVLGPYEDIHATLTQTYSAVQIGDTLKENLRASQQIVLSGGVDDDGLFTFSFDDERYLPFEGTGAISGWALEFTSTDVAARNRLFESLTDIILKLHYTAKAG